MIIPTNVTYGSVDQYGTFRCECEYCNGLGHYYEGDIVITTCTECNGTGEDYNEEIDEDLDIFDRRDKWKDVEPVVNTV